MKRFRGTQKQDVVVRKRKETPAVEVTLIGEEDVVKKTNSPLGRLSFEAENTAGRPWKSSDKVLNIIWSLRGIQTSLNGQCP